MRFIVRTDGAERLGLDPGRVCYLPGQKGPDGEPVVREFSGPPVREGLLAGFPRGVIGWGKKALKVQRTEQLDLLDQRLLYYVLSIRSVDHTLVPITMFDDLAVADFELVRHVVPFLDQDGDCGECSMPVSLALHLSDDDATGRELPPTTAPGDPGTTATATG